MRRFRRECLISTTRWDTLLYFPPQTPLSFHQLSSAPLFVPPFLLLFLLWVSSNVCGLPYPLSAWKEEVKKKAPVCFLWLQPSKTPRDLLFPCSIFHSLFLHSSLLSHSLSFGILPANKFLTSHKVSVTRQENKHSASQPASCLSSQSVSLLPSQPDGYLLSGTLMQGGKSRDQACQQVCTCQQVLVMLLPHENCILHSRMTCV